MCVRGRLRDEASRPVSPPRPRGGETSEMQLPKDARKLVLHDRLWSAAGRLAGGTGDEVLVLDNRGAPRSRDVDVCIVTNCTFPGGNAATTLTEALAFEAAGLSVAIVHCSIKSSPWKWNRVSARYRPVLSRMISAHWVERISCRTVIVRAPRMMMTQAFARLVPKIRPERAIFVVNNSAHSEDGGAIFAWPALHRRVADLDWPQKELCPTSPIIREESARDLAGTDVTDVLSERDWPPVLDEEAFRFAPHPRFGRPTVIGRHARDHPGKWLEDPAELLAAYPAEDPAIRVRILGGATAAARVLGRVPAGWEVLPFGTDGVQAYLDTLDVFVNFPSPERHEAFGRTVVEANLAGVPVLLPPRFEATFGDLAFYCRPEQVRGLIARLGEDDAGRLAYLSACRDLAVALYCTPSLLRRLKDGEGVGRPHLAEPLQAWRAGVMARA